MAVEALILPQCDELLQLLSAEVRLQAGRGFIMHQPREQATLPEAHVQFVSIFLCIVLPWWSSSSGLALRRL